MALSHEFRHVHPDTGSSDRSGASSSLALSSSKNETGPGNLSGSCPFIVVRLPSVHLGTAASQLIVRRALLWRCHTRPATAPHRNIYSDALGAHGLEWLTRGQLDPLAILLSGFCN